MLAKLVAMAVRVQRNRPRKALKTPSYLPQRQLLQSGKGAQLGRQAAQVGALQGQLREPRQALQPVKVDHLAAAGLY